MQDKEQKKDDQLIDDADFDLDEFDEDLADDDSWDEFDDGKTEKAVETKSAGGGGQKKSFLQKNFTVIVIAVALVVGGVLFLGLAGGKKSSPSVQESLAVQGSEDVGSDSQAQTEMPQIEDVAGLSSSTEDLPPMPVPFHTSSEEAAGVSMVDLAAENKNADAPENAAADALTPMPEETPAADDEILSEFAIDKVPAVPVTDEMLQVADEKPLEFAASETPAAEPAANVENVEATEQPKTIIDQALLDQESENGASANTASPASETELFASEFEAVPLTPAPIETPPEVSSDAPSDMAANANLADDFSGQIETLEEKMDAQNAALSDSLSKTNSKIDSLATSIASLEERLEQLSRSPVKTTEMQSSPAASSSKETVVAPKPSPAKPEPAKKPSSSKSASAPETAPADSRPATVTKWQLRAAQPGQALVSPTGSNEMVTVHIGDTLPGVGEILDITIEGQKWIIRGTEGIVSQ